MSNLEAVKCYQAKNKEKPELDPTLPDCMIVDIDGTIAQMHNRGPFEWEKVDQDKPRLPVLWMIKARQAWDPVDVILVSGRDEICRDQTELWLAGELDYSKLFMRPADDTRRDSIIKREIYEREILGKYNVVAIFDDRPSVIRECWQELGFGDRIFNVGSGKEF